MRIEWVRAGRASELSPLDALFPPSGRARSYALWLRLLRVCGRERAVDCSVWELAGSLGVEKRGKGRSPFVRRSIGSVEKSESPDYRWLAGPRALIALPGEPADQRGAAISQSVAADRDVSPAAPNRSVGSASRASTPFSAGHLRSIWGLLAIRRPRKGTLFPHAHFETDGISNQN